VERNRRDSEEWKEREKERKTERKKETKAKADSLKSENTQANARDLP